MKNDIVINQKKNGFTFFPSLIVLNTFFSLWLICSVDSTLYVPTASVVKKIIAASFPIVWMYFLMKGSIKIDKNAFIFCFFPVFYYFLSYFNHYDDDHFASLFSIFLLLIFLITDTHIKAKVFLLFKKVLIWMSVLGIICYIAYFIHLPLPNTTVPYYGDENWSYIYYYIAVLCNCEGQIRLCGLFNEPGYFGTILGIILSIEEINLKKRENVILFIAGFFTYSLAFFLTIILCYILRNISKKAHWVGFIMLVASYLFILPNIHTGSPMIDNIIERIQIKDNKLVGDNRSTESLDFLLATTIISDKAFWGNGMGYVASFKLNTSSYKTIIIDSGLAGFFVLYVCLFIILVFKNRHDKNALLAIILFFINIYQRPNIYNMIFFVVLFGGLALIENRRITENASSYNRYIFRN